MIFNLKQLFVFWSIISTIVVAVGLIFFNENRIFSGDKNVILDTVYVYRHYNSAILIAPVFKEKIDANSFADYEKDFLSNPEMLQEDTLFINPYTRVLLFEYSKDSTLALIGYPNPYYRNEISSSELINPRLRFGTVSVKNIHNTGPRGGDF